MSPDPRGPVAVNLALLAVVLLGFAWILILNLLLL